MKSTVILFLCVTSFVRVRGVADTVELDIPETAAKTCGKDMRLLHQAMMNATCRVPREKLVTLTSKTGIPIFPPQIYLKRCDCDHKCPANLQCVPMQTAMKRQTISVLFNGSSRRKCLEVELLEHTQCTCGCLKTPEDCNEYQHFEPEQCSCACNNERTQEEECKQRGRVWNKEICTCESGTKPRRCPTGFTWSMDYDACIKIATSGERPTAEEGGAFD